MRDLQAKARELGLWNLFMTHGSWGAGLTNLEYAPLMELAGRSIIGPEALNCSAPDTGNMEILAMYGTPEQQDRWLRPLLECRIRSAFAMTEPAVASSDARNITATIRRDGDDYVLNGRKWYTSGVLDPDCRLIIFMGKSDPDGPTYRQQSMILVPADAPGVEVLRDLTMFGYEDRLGHGEVQFTDVRVPATNMLGAEGDGFAIAQGRLGPGPDALRDAGHRVRRAGHVDDVSPRGRPGGVRRPARRPGRRPRVDRPEPRGDRPGAAAHPERVVADGHQGQRRRALGGRRDQGRRDGGRPQRRRTAPSRPSAPPGSATTPCWPGSSRSRGRCRSPTDPNEVHLRTIGNLELAGVPQAGRPGDVPGGPVVTGLGGRVALVTGATRGLGYAIALGLAEAGATVVVSSRKADSCEAAAEAITKATGVAAVPLALHVGQWDEHRARRSTGCTPTWGGSTSSSTTPASPRSSPTLESVSEGLFDKTIEVNLKGPFRLMAVAGARMAAAGGGSIVNISSIGAVRPSPQEAMYAASKNGLNALTMAFAQEYAPHVRVNCVMPGAFATDMADGWDEEFVGKVVDRLPAGRLGRPDEVVGMVVHLAGDSSGYTTGAVIPVDGGRTAVY